MHDLNTQIKATPKMDKFSIKCIFLGEIAKVGGGHLVQVPKAFEDTEIIKISESIEANGLERKLSDASQ